MKGQIDGLKAGMYHSKDDSLLCKVCKSDKGVHLEIADFEGNFYYAVTIDDEGKADFELGIISQTLLDDERMDEDGQD